MKTRRNSPRGIRVMIVEDSVTVRQFLEVVIGNDPRLEVVASMESAEAAIEVLDRAAPDVISMDIRLPGMNGLEATKKIMEIRPTPIVVVSASIDHEDLKISMNALRAGALSVIEKPAGTLHEGYTVMAERLCTQLAIMSQVKVIRQRFNHLDRPPYLRENTRPVSFQKSGASLRTPICMVGIVASTGGPKALQELLGGLTRDFPVPIVLVQHIGASFHGGFVSWLNDMTPLTVVEGRTGDVPRPGHVYVAGPECHLCVGQNSLYVSEGEPVCANRPSGTVLFRSMAENLGEGALGVLLTGMGRDGAEGLRDIRERGGYTIAEDESTAVVYGMPAAAVELHAACESLPLPAIAPRLRDITAGSVFGSYTRPVSGALCP